MSKYLLILLAFVSMISCNALDDTDTVMYMPTVGKPDKLNTSGLSDASNKPAAISMNGQQNYHAAQQIFYIYGLQHWKHQNGNNLADKAGSDYLVTPGLGAHKLHIRKLTWNRARRICIQEGGHLAVINSNSEEKLLLRILEENKIPQAWLGVHDLFEEGDWVTINDEPMESVGYSKWTTKIANEPDNYGGKQHCGVLLKDGGMDDLECGALAAFFCKITA